MKLKETLTIKPDGFKIRARLRGTRSAALMAARRPPRLPRRHAGATGATRPGHNTPLLVLYGSNLGTAEELATRVADLAELNGFATKLAPLDQAVGKLPEQGGVLIFCASYNGAPPDNATQFVKWLQQRPAEGRLRRRALRGVRLRQQRLGRDLSVDAAADRRAVAARGAPSVYARGEGDARGDLDGEFESWFAKLAPLAAKEFGIESSSAAAPTTSRSTASSRCRRRRSTRSSRSAALRQ